MTDISVIILVGQERLHMRRCLEKLALLEPRQVFVVTSQPDDGTGAIAEEMGASVVFHAWPGTQAQQFNWALNNLQLEGAWVLRLDADEYLTPVTIERLRGAGGLDSLSDAVAAVTFELRRRFCGGEIRHATVGIRQVRLFRRGKARYAETLMDERLEVAGRVVDFDGAFYDDNLNTIDWWRAKHRAYAKREAQQAVASLKSGVWVDARKARYYRLPPYFRAAAYFVLRYFVKGGFLDGYAGWMWNFWQGLWYRWLVDREIGSLRAEGPRDRTGSLRPEGPRDRTGSLRPEGPRDRTGSLRPEGSRDRTGSLRPEGSRDRAESGSRAKRQETGVVMGMRLKVFVGVLLAAAGVWAAGLGLWARGIGGRVCEAQRQVWVCKGNMLLSDYYMPWRTAHEGYRAGTCAVEMPHCSFTMTDADRAYPAFAMLLHRLLPCSLSAAVGYSVLGLAAFMGTLLLVASGRVWPLALVASAPVVFSLERGNPIWFAAAAVAVFLAWWDREDDLKLGPIAVKKKYVAAVALAIASVLKISPAVLGVLFLRRRDWRAIGVCGVTGALLFAVPFAWSGGVEGVLQWLQNACENGRLMSAHAAFGLYPFARVVKVLLGYDWHAGVAGWRIATQFIGFGLLVLACRVRARNNAILLAVIGMMFAAGNMMFYGALYLLPVFVLRARDCSRGELLLWFALLCLLQVPVLHVTANHLMAAAAVVGLVRFGLGSLRREAPRDRTPSDGKGSRDRTPSDGKGPRDRTPSDGEGPRDRTPRDRTGTGCFGRLGRKMPIALAD